MTREYRTIIFQSGVDGDLERLNDLGGRGWRVVCKLSANYLLLEKENYLE